jgi:hypothetical protein
MAREWQQTKMTEYVMPNAVYYQSIWAVRDFERMQKRIKFLEKENDRSVSKGVVKEKMSKYDVGKPVEKMAVEKAILEERVDGIKRALSVVPEEYRSYVLANIVLKNPGITFPDKVWRKWKQVFLFRVAKNLSMI